MFVEFFKLIGGIASLILMGIQFVVGVFYIIMMEKHTICAIGSFLFVLGFFLPFWCLSFLNNNRKWDEIKKFEKYFVYAMIFGMICSFLICIIMIPYVY